MESIEAGLIRGRHELPAEKYIFEEIENPLDFSAIYMRAESFVMTERFAGELSTARRTPTIAFTRASSRSSFTSPGFPPHWLRS